MSSEIDKTANFTAYEEVDLLANFSSHDEIIAHRRRRMEKYNPAANFIANQLTNRDAKLSVVEIGSGNSALLYKLARQGILKHGVGIESSKSRFDFAEQWKADDGYDVVENVNDNFASVALDCGAYDLYVVIDNTFTYLYPEHSAYPDLLLQSAYTALRPGGSILLDFINYTRLEPGIELRQWHALHEDDPFSYGLYSTKIADGINTTALTYIRRNGGSPTGWVEYSKIYSLAELTELMNIHGFKVSEVFSDFNRARYDAERSERMVVLATRDGEDLTGTN